MSALTQQRQAPEGSQSSILDVIRTELDEKIDKLTKAQSNISTLVGIVFTLRCDTNSLLEAQSALHQGTQEVAITIQSVSGGDAHETAKVSYRAPSKTTFRLVYVKTVRDYRNNRSRQMSMFLTTIRSCRYDNSTDIESDDSNDEYVSGDRQAILAERQHETSFFRKRIGPKREPLTGTGPSDPAFDQLMIYRYYRLMNTSHVCLAEKSRKTSKRVKTFQATFENATFGGEDPILLFDFFTTFVEGGNTLGVSKVRSFTIIPKLLKRRSESICSRFAMLDELAM